MIPLVKRFLNEPAFFLAVLASGVSFLASDALALPHAVKVVAVTLSPLLAGAATRGLVVAKPMHVAAVKAAKQRKRVRP